LQVFDAASSLPPPCNFDAQRKVVLWHGTAIKMQAYNEYASFLCLLFILKRHRGNIVWLRAELPSTVLALFLATFHARRIPASNHRKSKNCCSKPVRVCFYYHVIMRETARRHKRACTRHPESLKHPPQKTPKTPPQDTFILRQPHIKHPQKMLLQ
jgi:hypothetical protein